MGFINPTKHHLIMEDNSLKNSGSSVLNLRSPLSLKNFSVATVSRPKLYPIKSFDLRNSEGRAKKNVFPSGFDATKHRVKNPQKYEFSMKEKTANMQSQIPESFTDWTKGGPNHEALTPVDNGGDNYADVAGAYFREMRASFTPFTPDKISAIAHSLLDGDMNIKRCFSNEVYTIIYNSFIHNIFYLL